jgi:hypothetical protein
MPDDIVNGNNEWVIERVHSRKLTLESVDHF